MLGPTSVKSRVRTALFNRRVLTSYWHNCDRNIWGIVPNKTTPTVNTNNMDKSRKLLALALAIAVFSVVLGQASTEVTRLSKSRTWTCRLALFFSCCALLLLLRPTSLAALFFSCRLRSSSLAALFLSLAGFRESSLWTNKHG